MVYHGISMCIFHYYMGFQPYKVVQDFATIHRIKMYQGEFFIGRSWKKCRWHHGRTSFRLNFRRHQIVMSGGYRRQVLPAQRHLERVGRSRGGVRPTRTLKAPGLFRSSEVARQTESALAKLVVSEVKPPGWVMFMEEVWVNTVKPCGTWD